MQRSRRKERYPVEIEATVHRTDGSTVGVRLTDFSDQGCRIDSCEEFRIGERLQIAIPRMGKVKVQVRWALPSSAGAKFLVESDF